MKVIGNIIPETVTVEPYRPMKGYAEVRLRENVQEVVTPDGIMYEYDEYVIHARSKDGLAEEIENNLEDWLITGRTVEVNENASLVRDMQAALTALGYPDSLKTEE